MMRHLATCQGYLVYLVLPDQFLEESRAAVGMPELVPGSAVCWALSSLKANYQVGGRIAN